MAELVRTAERILSGPISRHVALRPERTWDGRPTGPASGNRV